MNDLQRKNYQLVVMIDAAQTFIEAAGGCPGETSCMRCEHYEPPARCLKFKLEIPKGNIAGGCSDFEQYIPF